jgi:hypothetical protein
LPLDRELDPQTRGARALEETVEVREPGLRRQLGSSSSRARSSLSVRCISAMASRPSSAIPSVAAVTGGSGTVAPSACAWTTISDTL